MSRLIFFNLTQIRMPVGAITSIAHRVTGVLLALGVPLFICLLGLSVESPQGYERVGGMLELPALKLALMFFVWALAHHCLAGILCSAT